MREQFSRRQAWVPSILFFILAQIAAGALQASTFVGNGGHSGDVEKQVALREIADTLLLIDKNKSNAEFQLCTCYPALNGHPSCDFLSKLTPPKLKFCADFLREHSREMARTAQQISSRGFVWTRDDIEVLEGGAQRPADAVTNYEAQTITVNQQRFLDAHDYERVFILSHEIGHLQKWQEAPLKDSQEVGPFTGPEGGREFLNSLAAAVTMEALDTRVMSQYSSSLNRSRGHNMRWAEISAASSTSPEVAYGVSKTQGTGLSYRQQFTDMWGAEVAWRQTKGTATALTSTHTEERITAYSLGLALRYFPFENPLSFWGQSHFVLGAGVEKLAGEYSLSDGFISTQATANSTAGYGSVSYFLPIIANFWVNAKITATGHQYKYQIPFAGIEMKSSAMSQLGVSYGF